jgi:hypothetical protein
MKADPEPVLPRLLANHAFVPMMHLKLENARL